MKNLTNFLSLVLTLAIVSFSNIDGNAQKFMTKLGVDLTGGGSTFTNELVNVSIKETVPPISWLQERRVNKYLSIGTELGYAQYSVDGSGSAFDNTGIGNMNMNVHSIWGGLRATITYPVNEMVEVYAGGGARYTMVYVQNNNSFFDTIKSPAFKRGDGHGIAGVNLHLGEGFGLFAEGGIMKDYKYFRVGIILSR